MNAIHIVNAVNYLLLDCKVISVLVQMVNFLMIKVDNFSMMKLMAMYFKLFDGDDGRIVVSKSER